MGCISATTKAERRDGLAGSARTDEPRAGSSIAAATVRAFTSVACVAPGDEFLAASKNVLWLSPSDLFEIYSNTGWVIV
jgi:hypothetical protein